MRDRIARRRVAHFGWLYGYDSWKIEPGPPIPKFLHTARERAGALAGVKAGDLAEVLITEYPPGAPIGWHRDAPMFGVVVAVSLLAAARLRLRNGTRGRATAALTIEPRSAYVLSGPVRTNWQHSISPVKTTRYSITFRTLRASKTGQRPENPGR
jgi:alkylated DNA repair dioxygenase AlkB